MLMQMDSKYDLLKVKEAVNVVELSKKAKEKFFNKLMKYTYSSIGHYSFIM